MTRRRVPVDSRRWDRWPAGLDNVRDDHELNFPRESRGLREALNVDIDNAGKVKRRRGMKNLTGRVAHSAWSDPGFPVAFAVNDGWLSRIRQQGSEIVVDPIVEVGRFHTLSYALHDGFVYYTGASESGVLDANGNRWEWGVEHPAGVPLLTEVSGGSLDGHVRTPRDNSYRVAITYAKASGEESGAPAYAEVDVDPGSSVQLDGIPQPSSDDVVAVRIWQSKLNGEGLYYRTQVPVGVTSVTLSGDSRNKLLETLFHERIPRGRIVRSYRGRLFVARGQQVFYTPAMRPGLCRLDQDMWAFESEVRFMETVGSGIYVGLRDRVVFMAGADPKDMQQRVVVQAGAVHGASTTAPAKALGTGLEGSQVAVWVGLDGVFYWGDDSGSVTAMNSDRLSIPEYRRGTLAYREQDGVRSVVGVLQQPEQESRPTGFVAADKAVAKVIRNGVEIPGQPLPIKTRLRMQVAMVDQAEAEVL